MPTHTIPGAVLNMAGNDGAPWKWPTWQRITGLGGAPWSGDPDATPRGWTPAIVQKVAAFVKNYLARKPAERLNYIRTVKRKSKPKRKKKSKSKPKKGKDKAASSDDMDTASDTDTHDNDSEGRANWVSFVSRNLRKWGISRTIDDILKEHDHDPYSIMEQDGTTVMGDLESAQLSGLYPAIAAALFGDEAIIGTGVVPRLHAAASDFLNVIMVHIWHRWKRAIRRQTDGLAQKRADIDATWAELTAPDAKPTAAQLRRFLSMVEKFIQVLKLFQDPVSQAEFEEMKAKLSDMLAQTKAHGKDLGSKRVPKALRDALRLLASEGQVRAITADLNTLINGNTYDTPVEIDFDEIPHDNWEEGVEEYRHLTVDDLWQYLGTPTKELPFFNVTEDQTASRDPWSTEGEAFLQTAEARPFGPRWHQLVGILKLVKKMLAREAVLLMDEVGVGKTMQAVGLIAMRAYYREYYAQHKKFPGIFGNVKYNSADGNLEDEPVIIVCPVNLEAQFTDEIHRYLRRGTFDLLPYTGKHASRPVWWSEIMTQSKQPPARRIVLALVTAIQSDSDAVFVQKLKPKHGDAVHSRSYNNNVSSTVYGYTFGLTIMDEAHTVRTLNKVYMAARELRKCSRMTVAMTATPVMTRPTDVWNMGRFLGIPAFEGADNDKEAHEMEKRLAAAQRRDRRLRNEVEDADQIVTRVAHGKGVKKAVEGEYPDEVLEAMQDIRQRFVGSVIRRTVNSVDNNNQPISGLSAYAQHSLLLTMTEAERLNVDNLAEEMAENAAGASSFTTGSNFYLNIRRALTHPACNYIGDWVKPTTIEEWQRDSSVKMNALVDIVRHHLNADGAPPLCIETPGSNVLVPDLQAPVDSRGPHSLPDKLVIFVAFPANCDVLLAVFGLYGIKVLLVTGEVPVPQRAAVLKQFHEAKRDDARVLILSNVGLVGLNLACANIMVVLDTLWSAQDDSQLIGRIWRQPQPKQVHVYRPIAMGTPDVFLNNISFGKSAMHKAFTGASDPLQKAFGQESETESEIDGEDADPPEEADPPEKVKDKGKGKATAPDDNDASDTPPKETKAPPKKAKQKKAPAKETPQKEPVVGTKAAKKTAAKDTAATTAPATTEKPAKSKSKSKPKPKRLPKSPAVVPEEARASLDAVAVAAHAAKRDRERATALWADMDTGLQEGSGAEGGTSSLGVGGEDALSVGAGSSLGFRAGNLYGTGGFLGYPFNEGGASGAGDQNSRLPERSTSPGTQADGEPFSPREDGMDIGSFDPLREWTNHYALQGVDGTTGELSEDPIDIVLDR
ncbi:P-loop containing nucleoside triphosphate hydrolase protein, partial [Amylocystis lapponica]